MCEKAGNSGEMSGEVRKNVEMRVKSGKKWGDMRLKSGKSVDMCGKAVKSGEMSVKATKRVGMCEKAGKSVEIRGKVG